jgi:hypothetical protein
MTIPPDPRNVPPPVPPHVREQHPHAVRATGWAKEHIVILVIAAVVVFGLLVAIGTGTINLPGHRDTTTAPSSTTTQ